MSSSETPSKFWDRLAADYAQRPVPDESAYERTLERVQSRLSPGDRLLEVGCGTGTTALRLAPHAREIVATDYSAEMIAIAVKKASAARVNNVSFKQCKTDDLVHEPAPFDVVMAMNLLHLIGDLPGELARIHGLVRPGGLFISKTPCVGEQGLAVRLLIPLLRAVGRAPYVNFVTERALGADIAGAGFEVLETGMYPKKSKSYFVVARRTE